MDSNESRSPKYAIISLPDDFDLPNAAEKLKQIGFPYVQFVHNLSEYMEQKEETRENATKEEKMDKNGTNYLENAVKMENMDTLLSLIASPVVDDSRSVARKQQQQQDCQQQQQQDDDVIVIDEFLRSSRSRNGFSSLPVVPKQMTLEEAIKREQKLYELHKEAAVNKDEDDDSVEILEDSGTSSQQQQFPISSTNDMISCMVCHKNLTYKGSINGLIAHAKRHHYLKPYGCPLCDYFSTVALQVRQHLYHKHRAYLKPDVHIDDTMRDVWLKLATKCFPEVADRFEQHTFSKPRSPKVLNIGMFNFDNLVLPLPTSPSL